MSKRKSPPARARLEDVAELAKVSKSTASKVLNDSPDAAARPETRQRVLDAAAALDYRPHEAARALAGAQARALALLVPELTNPVYAQLVRGAFAEAQTRGYTVLVAEDDQDMLASGTMSTLVAAGRVDGILVASARERPPLAARLAQGIPHVFVNRPVAGSERNVTVRMGDAIRLAVAHFVELGHRSIGQIAGPVDVTAAQIRSQAFTDAVTSARVQGAVAHAEFDERGGATGAEQLLAELPGMSAVVCNSLSQAVGAISALRRAGRGIPEDVSIIAYDDLPLADFLTPPLDTIAMPLDELGRAAVDALVDQIEGGRPHDVELADEPRLVLRGSSRALDAGADADTDTGAGAGA